MVIEIEVSSISCWDVWALRGKGKRGGGRGRGRGEEGGRRGRRGRGGERERGCDEAVGQCRCF